MAGNLTPSNEKLVHLSSQIFTLYCLMSGTRPPSYLQVPRPPTVPAPPVIQGNASPSEPSGGSTTHFSTVRSEVRSGAIRIDITNPEQWSAGDTAILRNQQAKKVPDIGSLIFETPIQHGYEAGVEVRSLLPTERLEEMDGRLAVTDEDPHTPGVRYVQFVEVMLVKKQHLHLLVLVMSVVCQRRQKEEKGCHLSMKP